MLALVMGCGGAAEDDAAAECERSAYELERTRYGCASADGHQELRVLECGEWVTVEACEEGQVCRPGPMNIGCFGPTR
jgi:hypothetical protein